MFRAPGVVFQLQCDSPAFLSRFAHCFHALSDTRSAPDTIYRVHDRGPAFPGRWTVHRDGAPVTDQLSAEEALGEVLADLDELVMERGQPHGLVVHASAVEVDGRVVLMPAASGSGKTTLAAGAVAAGAGYVTDECVVIDRATLQVTPYPRPLCIKPGSQGVVRRLLLQPDAPASGGSVWHLRPDLLGGVSSGGRVAAVVVPVYRPDAVAELQVLTRAEAMLAVGAQAGYLARGGPEVLSVLRDVASSGPCRRLVFSDLAQAVQLLHEVLA